ncbi:MAG: hypothetical protein P1U89_02180 [Verrucomicrobiales bacterium]|nr:hypothetical protein [Verrucomicrobiales bacterium]
MKFPLQLTFPIISVAQQFTVTDADENTVCYVRQKILKIREAIEVFTDKKRTTKICDIKADRIIDFSATYQFFDTDGKVFGAVARKGMRSIFKAHYEIFENDKADMIINEENPFVKMIDGFIGQIPIVGAFTGLMFHPSYLVADAETGKELIRIRKQSSFFEAKFTLEQLCDLDDDDELRIVLSTIMLVLLEKDRG